MIDIFDDIKDLVFGNKRLDELKKFSNQHDFRFARRVNINNVPFEFNKMEFFQGERKKSIKGFLYRSELNERAIGYIYDYLYFSEFGKKTTTVFHFKLLNKEFPHFAILPRNRLKKLSQIFNSTEWSDLSRDFDKQFEVKSEEMNFMRMNLTIQLAELMLKLQSFSIEGYGNHLCIYQKNTIIDIDDLQTIYKDGLEALDILSI